MIRVLFFGQVADLVGRRELEMPSESLGLHELRTRLFGEGANGGTMAAKVLMSLNSEVVRDDQMLKSGDEVAFFSPFSGG